MFSEFLWDQHEEGLHDNLQTTLQNKLDPTHLMTWIWFCYQVSLCERLERKFCFREK